MSASQIDVVPGHCVYCGQLVENCKGCGRMFDPPRFCLTCGHRLTVLIMPNNVRLTCRQHGDIPVPTE